MTVQPPQPYILQPGEVIVRRATFVVCAACGKAVNQSGPFGSWHICLNTCEIRGHHGRAQRSGFLWRRRRCEDCWASLA